MNNFMNFLLGSVLYGLSIALLIGAFVESDKFREYALAAFVGFCAASLQQMLSDKK